MMVSLHGSATAHSSVPSGREEMCLACARLGTWCGRVLGIRSCDGSSPSLCQQLRGCRSASCCHPDCFKRAGIAPALPSELGSRREVPAEGSRRAGRRGTRGTSLSLPTAQGARETRGLAQAKHLSFETRRRVRWPTGSLRSPRPGLAPGVRGAAGSSPWAEDMAPSPCSLQPFPSVRHFRLHPRRCWSDPWVKVSLALPSSSSPLGRQRSRGAEQLLHAQLRWERPRCLCRGTVGKVAGVPHPAPLAPLAGVLLHYTSI